MSLHRALAGYLRVRRSLGFQLERAGKLLPDFLAYLDERGHSYITTTAALAWSTLPRNATPAWWSARLLMVRGFAKYLQTLDPRTEVPPPELLPHRRVRSMPYVYSTEDISALLSATDTLCSPFRMTTYKTLLGLLAATGMRVGEAIALDDSDFQRRRAILVIRKAKFGKSREVPLHASTVHALDRYRREREQAVSRRRTSSLFVSGHGTRLFYQNVHITFLRLVYEAGLGERKPRPTIHDLRHTFAIRTVLDWHRDHLDVEARLPLLSTYLGHVSPSSTYWYLSAIPELLEAATVRLTRYVQGAP